MPINNSPAAQGLGTNEVTPICRHSSNFDSTQFAAEAMMRARGHRRRITFARFNPLNVGRDTSVNTAAISPGRREYAAKASAPSFTAKGA